MGIYRSDDPAADFERWDADNEARRQETPICCRCEHHIQDERLFDIEGNLYHEECAMEEFRKWTEDYI